MKSNKRLFVLLGILISLALFSRYSDSNMNTISPNVTSPVETTQASINSSSVKSIDEGSPIISAPSNIQSKVPVLVTFDDLGFKTAVTSNVSQAKDLAISLNGFITKDNLSDKMDKALVASGYSGYVSRTHCTIANNTGYITFDYKGGSANFLTKINAVNANVKAIINKVVKPNMTEYDKELALHDYVVNNVCYDAENLLNKTIPEDSYTSYGALIKKVAVCEGYAEAMNILLISAGIKSYIIDGYSGGALHEWNLVNIHGSLYHLDATFDDPISAKGNVITHNYFNVNDEQISKDHTWDKVNYPSTNAVEANYFVVNKLLVSDGSMYYQVIKNAIMKRISIINIRTRSYDAKTYNPNVIAKVLKEITTKNNASKSLSYSFSYDPNSCVIEIALNYK